MFQQVEENERLQQNKLDSQKGTSPRKSTTSVEKTPETGGFLGGVYAALCITVGFPHTL
jgi:hypothetical protein